MQQRQLRLGDILDDYCPRERRVTNHAVVAMVGDNVKQTRCTTCDAEHEYKQAKVPRQRRKNDAPAALYAQVAAGAPKRVVHDPAPGNGSGAPENAPPPVDMDEPLSPAVVGAESVAANEPQADVPPPVDDVEDDTAGDANADEDEGPIHRRLIRASLPRPDGQQPPARPIPEFTIRQPGGGGRPSRFRPRHRGGQGPHFQGSGRPTGNMGGPMRGQRQNAGHPGMKRHGPHGRKRSK